MINVPNRDVFEEVRKHKDSSDKYQAENYIGSNRRHYPISKGTGRVYRVPCRVLFLHHVVSHRKHGATAKRRSLECV